MQVTVTSLYGRPFPGTRSFSPACPAAVALPPGSQVTLKASFSSGGEACPSADYTAESITAPDYSASGQRVVYVSGSCSGTAGNFALIPLANDNVSFYAGPQQDGGASWGLAVDFFADPDAGACNVNSWCTDLYIGSNEKL